jgi:hypothetical protein
MTKFLGRGQLLNRLAYQTGNRDMAKQILIDRGHMRADGTLTPAGIKRDNMTAAERAIERASKQKAASRPKLRLQCENQQSVVEA